MGWKTEEREIARSREVRPMVPLALSRFRALALSSDA
jgi:hypothetical protein